MGKKLNFITLFLFLCNLLIAQITPPIVPDSIYSYQFENTNLSSNGLLLTTPFKLFTPPGSSGYITPYPQILDQDGSTAWFSKKVKTNCLDFKYYPNENIYSYTTIIGSPKVVLLNSDLEIIDTITVINGTMDVHDIQRANNGNWLIASYYLDTVDLSASSFGSVQGDDSTVIVGFGVQEIDPSNNIVFEWNSNDYINPTEGYLFYGYDSTNYDYCHGNALEEDIDGNLLLSFRHLNSIYKIDRISGQVIWKLGGKSSDFTFSNDYGFSGQHDIRRLANGNYSLFDNANMASSNISRGVEYSLDTVNWTALKVDEFIHPDQFFARAMGSYQKLDNADRVLCYGLIYEPYPNVSFFNSNHEVIASLRFQDSVVSYRAHYYPNLTLPRPLITCEDIAGTTYISGPDGASEYLWSTGETTQSITVTQVDTFQVWVPYGSGYIGSHTFIVSDLSNPCLNATIEEQSIEFKGPFKLYDLMGREVKTPEPFQVYIKLYSNGTSEKFMILEE